MCCFQSYREAPQIGLIFGFGVIDLHDEEKCEGDVRDGGKERCGQKRKEGKSAADSRGFARRKEEVKAVAENGKISVTEEKTERQGIGEGLDEEKSELLACEGGAIAN